MSLSAEELKNAGNTAFSAGKFEEAIKHFSDAIAKDPNNHVLYSNRSAAYASLKKYGDALSDAEKCIDIKPEWAKGYGRKGAALFGSKKLDEAAAAYKQGLELEPANATLKQGLDDVEKEKSSKDVPSNINEIFSQLFSGDLMAKIRNNPMISPYLNQPDFVKIITEIQKDPNNLTKYLNDQRLVQVMGVLMGINVERRAPPSPSQEKPQEAKKEEAPKKEETPKKAEPTTKSEPKKAEPEPMDISDDKKAAESEKQKGNDAYKNKDFETAIKHYEKAMQHDPSNIVYLLNRAAVYLEIKRFDDCIKDCEKAIEEGRKQRVDYSQLARAYQRMGKAYEKMENWDKAADSYEKSLTEHRTPETLKLLQGAEKVRDEQKKTAYQDPQKAQEAKERGNALFRDGKYPEAVQEYTEAIKRNPTDPLLYSNRAACYTKLAEYHMALGDCDQALKIKPDFVKAITRKGHCYFFLKQYQKALETYDQGLKIEDNNQELNEAVQRTLDAMQKERNSSSDQEILDKALKDPEVQEILSDPAMRQILDDMQKDPKAAAEHLKNEKVMKKIQKLIDARVLRVGGM